MKGKLRRTLREYSPSPHPTGIEPTTLEFSGQQCEFHRPLAWYYMQLHSYKQSNTKELMNIMKFFLFYFILGLKDSRIATWVALARTGLRLWVALDITSAWCACAAFIFSLHRH